LHQAVFTVYFTTTRKNKTEGSGIECVKYFTPRTEVYRGHSIRIATGIHLTQFHFFICRNCLGFLRITVFLVLITRGHAFIKLSFAAPPVSVPVPADLHIVITGFYAWSGIVFLRNGSSGNGESQSAENQYGSNNKEIISQKTHDFTSDNL
jgi:hypothetical protein